MEGLSRQKMIEAQRGLPQNERIDWNRCEGFDNLDESFTFNEDGILVRAATPGPRKTE